MKRQILYGCLLLLAGGLASCRAGQVRRAVAGSPVFGRHFTGFVLYNPKTQKTIYAQNGDRYFTPASNTKLFTFYTALKILGDSVPALKYAVRNDSLYFWGTGDPALLHPDLATGPGGSRSSRVLALLGGRPEKLVYVAAPVKVNAFGPGWGWDDYNDYYSVERAPMPIYGNFMRLTASGAGAWQVQPRPFGSYFVEKPLLQRLLPASTALFQREPASNLFTLDAARYRRPATQDLPFRYTEQLLADLLADTLHRPVALYSRQPPRPAQTLYSIRTDSLYRKLLQESDNFVAEQLLLLCASRFSDTLDADSAIAYATRTLLNDLPDAPVWVDGSGLSRYNLFTPRSMVRLLQKIQATVPQDRLFSLLPAGGRSGTLKHFYTAQTPYVFAKTGTLSNVHCLSGYIVTRKRNVLLFSFMHNNHTATSGQLKQEMEKVLQTVRDRY